MSAKGLTDRNINYQSRDNFIYLQNDSTLCGDNMTISFMDRGNEKINDQKIKKSLRSAMNTDTETVYKVYENLSDGYKSVNYNNELGIEYVKEICIGYKNSLALLKWKELIFPEELKDNKSWSRSNLPEFQFTKSDIKEIQSITFKVKSLEKAKQYLLKNNLAGIYIDNEIMLNKALTFDLQIYLTDER